MAAAAFILLCVAVIVLAYPSWPAAHTLIAFVLALIALLLSVVPQVFH